MLLSLEDSVQSFPLILIADLILWQYETYQSVEND